MALRPKPPATPADKIAQRDAMQQDVFLREVDDALRQDEMMGAMKRYGRPLLAVVVLGLAGLGGYLWWDNNRTEAQGKHAEQLVDALDKSEGGNLDGAGTTLAPLAKDASDGPRAAAKLMQGGIAMQQGKPTDAAKLFAEVAADKDAPQPLRDLAAIREVAIKFDTMPPQQVVDRLKALAVPGNPWFGSAGELVGMAYMKQGKNNLAGPLFAAISRDKEAPESLRSRARQMAGLLGVDAIDDAEKAAQVAPQ